MSNLVTGWTERTSRDTNTTSEWSGTESSGIINNQGGKAYGSILTRDTPPDKLSNFVFKLNVDTKETAQGGAIVFYANDDGSEYYSITWKMVWNKTTFYLAKDNSSTGGDSTLINYWEVTTMTTNTSNMDIVLRVENQLVSFDANSTTNSESATWQQSLANIASGYTEGYYGFGAADTWESTVYKWYFTSIEELTPQPSNTRPRFWIIS